MIGEGFKNLDEKIDEVNSRLENVENRLENVEGKVDNLTDVVIEGFDNTERILSEWEGKPVKVVSQNKRKKIQKRKNISGQQLGY